MTTAPGLTKSAVTNLARPIATTKISALEATWAKLWVREWVKVTVAFLANSNWAMGFPTILERPMTTAFLPSSSMSYSRNISIIPAGVEGIITGWPDQRRPMLSGWKPSTSFSGSMANKTASSSMCFGKGNWTKIPCQAGSWLYLAIKSNNSSWVMVSVTRTTSLWKPAAIAERSLLRT